MLGRGTMISRTVVSANSKALWTSSSSTFSKIPFVKAEKPIRPVRKNRNVVRRSRAEFSPHADVKDPRIPPHAAVASGSRPGRFRFNHFSISTATKTRPATAAASVSSTALRGSVLKTPFRAGHVDRGELHDDGEANGAEERLVGQ